jgi:DNA-binding transcriptional LysR family regulator
MGKPPDDLPIRAVAFMKNPLVVIAAPDHPLAQARIPVTVPALLQHDFVLREPGSGTRMAMERFFRQQDQRLDANMEVNSNEAIKQAVAAGLGLGVVSIHTLEAELKEGRLALVEAEGFPLMRTWYLVQRRDKRLSPLAERFRDYVLEKAPELETNP